MVWNVESATLRACSPGELPHEVESVQGQWIMLKAGNRLSARWWIPKHASKSHPVPALLEFIPYRKNDCTALRDSIRHPYFAGFGYWSVRVDLRGSGDSEGILLDEYLVQEQEDAEEVIEWIAGQEWCNGNVGMFGKSWGGFNALQVAARSPPALKAIIAICATDDRYATDIHYMGGCLLAADQTSWGTVMLAYNGRPPDPKHVGASWRAQWLKRLEQTPAFLEAWMKHQTRDAYWQHGSVCEDFAAIRCPVLAVSGWADGYPDGVFRLLSGLRAPCLGIIGPWAHEYPEVATPAPNIGFLQEAVRWWDHWLAGKSTDVPQLPRLRAFIAESAPPAVAYAHRDGRWVCQREWPPAGHGAGRILRLDLKTCRLIESARAHEDGEEQIAQVPGEQSHGTRGGVWCNFGAAGDYADDQRAEDALALCFDADPASQPQHFLGFPQVSLVVSADQPCALVALRLCDCGPDGRSALVSEGLLNLTHCDGHEHPSPLVPGEQYSVQVHLKSMGFTLLPGHRWRLALSSTLWPRVWPSPRPVSLSLHSGSLSLPILSTEATAQLGPNDATAAATAPGGVASEAALVTWQDPEACPKMAHTSVRDEVRKKEVRRDVLQQTTTVTDAWDEGRIRLLEGGRVVSDAGGLEFETVSRLESFIRDDDPLSAAVRCTVSVGIARSMVGEEWETRVEASSELRSSAGDFLLASEIKAFEGPEQVFSRKTEISVPRSLV